MELLLPERVIESNFTGKTMGFRLDDESPIIFEILRKNMYADPIRAVVQEYISNARDANTEAGNENIPVEIWFNNNEFIVKDNGIGISPDRMENVCRWIGRSTKRGTNDQLGCFGLGFKVGNAVSDTWSIETVHDGIKYIYISKIGSDYKGDIDLLHEETTNDPSGTKIKVPIKNGEKYLYKNHAVSVTKFWSIPPKFVGDIQPEVLKPTIDTEHWAIYLKSIDNHNVIVGEIPYKDYQMNIPEKVVLKFKIGELSLASHRQSLIYDEKTNSAIKNKIQIFKDEMCDRIQRDLNTLTSFPEALALINSIPRSNIADQRSWKFNNTEFKYPLEQKIQSFDRPREKLSCTKSNTIGSCEDESFIELDKDELTSYDRQKIGYYLNNCDNARRIYLVPPGLLPINPKKLSEIKIIRSKSSGPKVVKTEIRGKSVYSNYGGWRSNSRYNYYPIDSPKDIIYYVEDPINGPRNLYNLGIEVIEITAKNEKFIKDSESWITLTEYVQQNLYDKLKLEEIQAIADKKATYDCYQAFKFLAGHHPDFDFLAGEVCDDLNILKFITFEVENNRITPKVPDLYKKYEVLGLCRTYLDEEEKQIIRNYVTLINEKELLNVLRSKIQSNSWTSR